MIELMDYCVNCGAVIGVGELIVIHYPMISFPILVCSEKCRVQFDDKAECRGVGYGR